MHRALRKTRNAGLQPALDYLQDHEDSTGETSGDEGDADGAAGASASVPEIQGEAKVRRDPRRGEAMMTQRTRWTDRGATHAGYGRLLASHRIASHRSPTY